ncbi:MAG: hydantoinase/oxoprolinase family protein, partial [Gammaproteobacteria bacterium]|nr:hydantoinase/oxoprolinase family protein [Gammaproteobacteria bacterium]
QARADLYDLQPPPAVPLIDPKNCLEVASRVSADGQPLSILSANDLVVLQRQLAQIKPDAVAINLLFSYLDESEEKRIENSLAADYFVSRSSAVLNEYREYERGVATCLNAYVGPLMKNYLSRLEAALPASGLSIMQSNGGTMSVTQAADYAVNLLLSGPAGGLKGAQFVASDNGARALLSFDMGGTSTDVAMIKEEITLTSEGKIAGLPVAVPMVDMHTIGAGGGSIARVDSGGLLLVGPESAGARPGPACYGNGGLQPTVTDANVVLGRIPAEQSLGGYLQLDKPAAEKAISNIASRLGVSAEQAALGIIRIANEHMVQALRVMSVQRGDDPKDFTLVSFGGAGGLHICELAEALNMNQALIPVHAGVLSAFGMLVAAPSREMSHSVNKVFEECSDDFVNELMTELSAQGHLLMLPELAGDEPQLTYSVDVCYSGQSFSLNVKWSNLEEVAEQFHRLHRKRYGHEMDNKLELVTIRLKLEGKPARFKLPELEKKTAAAETKVRLFGETELVSVYQRDKLGAGQHINGPALVLEKLASSYIKSGWQADVDLLGNLLIKRSLS